jgi:hypothetical protein
MADKIAELLKEFVADVEAVHGPDEFDATLTPAQAKAFTTGGLAKEWPDLASTYMRAKEALAELEGKS